MKRIVRLNENDLQRIVRRVLREQDEAMGGIKDCFEGAKFSVPAVCKAADTQDKCLKALQEMVMQSPVEIGNAIACVMSKTGKGGSTKGIKLPGYAGGSYEL